MGSNKRFIDFIKGKKAYILQDLLSVARKERIEIIVDSSAFASFLDTIIIKKIARDFDNPYLIYPLGENDFLSHIYCDIHVAFKEVGIDLVWILNDRKVPTDFTDRLNVKVNRIERQLARQGKIFSASHAGQEYNESIILSPFTREYGYHLLKKSGAEMIDMFHADNNFMIDIYRQRKSFAILSYDTSALMEGVNVLLLDLLNTKYDGNNLSLPFLNQITPGKMFTIPQELIFPITNSDIWFQSLNLENYDQFICAYAISNCFYNPDQYREINQVLNLRGSREDLFIEKLAIYVRNNQLTSQNLLFNPIVKDYMDKNPDVRLVVEKYLQLHSSGRFPDVATSSDFNDELTTFLKEEISNKRICGYCYTIHMGLYIHSHSIEQLPQDCNPIMHILEDIRAGIYPFLLNKKKSIVYDFRWRIRNYVEVNVKQRDVQANNIIPIPDGVKYFEEIWLCNESHELKYAEKFGIPKAFILYTLRYFYKVSYGKNLCISIDQFKSLFVTVFYHFYTWNQDEESDFDMTSTRSLERNSFLEMNICPTPECITINSWFVKIYDTAKFLCGGALNLTEHFPEIEKITNGSIYVAFYETLNNTGRYGTGFTAERRNIVRDSSDEILLMFNREYDALTEGN